MPNRLDETRPVPDGDQIGCGSEHGSGAPAVGGDDGSSLVQGLLDPDRLSLPVRCRDDEVCGREQVGDIAPVSEQPHGKVLGVDPFLQPFPERALTGDDDERGRTQIGEGRCHVEEQAVVLLVSEAADIDDKGPVRLQVEPGPHGVRCGGDRGRRRRRDDGDIDLAGTESALPVDEIGRDTEHQIGPRSDDALKRSEHPPRDGTGRGRVVQGDDDRSLWATHEGAQGTCPEPVGVDHIRVGGHLSQAGCGARVVPGVRQCGYLDRNVARTGLDESEVLRDGCGTGDEHVVPGGAEATHEVLDMAAHTAGAAPEDKGDSHRRITFRRR